MLTLLRRLESKGCVAVDRNQVAHVFSAAVDRDGLLRARLDDLTTDLCNGTPATLVQAYMSGRTITKREARELRDLVDQLEVNGTRWDPSDRIPGGRVGPRSI
ncbi:MAG: BlaI/MecI/CopY family transcriptional regulator [Planctomycetota bacterium]|nr:BlaI/MecI/CopY family transcriptional regulator [Planctomycetota bacterium]